MGALSKITLIIQTFLLKVNTLLQITKKKNGMFLEPLLATVKASGSFSVETPDAKEIVI